jgi:hypothetical protein
VYEVLTRQRGCTAIVIYIVHSSTKFSHVRKVKHTSFSMSKTKTFKTKAPFLTQTRCPHRSHQKTTYLSSDPEIPVISAISSSSSNESSSSYSSEAAFIHVAIEASKCSRRRVGCGGGKLLESHVFAHGCAIFKLLIDWFAGYDVGLKQSYLDTSQGITSHPTSG